MIKILELFGGIGAPRKSLINLGVDHKCIDYVEWQPNRVKAYNALYDHRHKPQDVRGWNLRPDILVHGSPCQDNSRGNKKRKGAAIGSRSQLMLETLRIIKEMGEWKPKVVIWENVKGVLDKDVISIFNYYLQQMVDIGYTNSFDVLDARNFGIPHARERVFCISLLGNSKFDFSKLKHRPMRNIKEFLEYGPDDKIPEQYLITIPSMLNKIKEFNPNPTGSYKRQLDVIDGYCYTITERQDRCPNAGIIRLNKPQYRYLTERECWRLLGFDDEDYDLMVKEFPTKEGKRNATLYALAGNSIVVQVLEAIFEVIIKEDYGTDLIADSSGQLQLIC
ncbi:DNA (cytosine-5)-methyltransferase 1 [Clostridium amylolyticum]|uniref:DNA (cytosine-5-)-methyltransferase n=1 Tax=Clostridium amylolyticum TaxID=1121298 RepID=A0A1M6L0Y1_9CLOT|nr:DNA (cytosine-5-)-methyltransferase [Clostridium amylolyticum]SHJ64786.1 DNA (cytosine-5)-methyltransferase 1 [Clostridium amylolyticum]